MQFITAPNGQDPADVYKVVFAQPQANLVFAAIAHDRKLPKRQPTGTRGGAAGVLLTSPSKVTVKVLNGSDVSGQAAQVSAALAKRGFKILSKGNMPGYGYANSVIEYRAATDLPAVNTLKAQLSHVTIRQDASLPAGVIELITGSSYTGLTAKAPHASASPASSASRKPSVSGLSSTTGGITGSARMCSTSGKTTFTGAGTVNG